LALLKRILITEANMKPFRFAVGMLVVVVTMAQAERGNSADLAQVLGERTLWGNDFPEALTLIQAWNRIGARAVAVFPDRIVGASSLPSQPAAQLVASDLSQALTETRPQPAPRFQPFMALSLPARPSFQTEVVPFAEDKSFRVALTKPSAQFLAPNLMVTEVKQRLGQPETTAQEVEQTEGERRPAIRTIYTYASGAVRFVESDLSPQPGSVDHVRLDVPVLSSTLFQ
jgi:hypothetical protein